APASGARPGSRPAAVDPGRVAAVDGQVARGGTVGPDDAPQERGLAGSVRPYHRTDLPGAKGEGDLVEDGPVAVPAAQIPHFQRLHTSTVYIWPTGPVRLVSLPPSAPSA